MYLLFGLDITVGFAGLLCIYTTQIRFSDSHNLDSGIPKKEASKLGKGKTFAILIGRHEC